MTSNVCVAGVGMIPFVKPGANAPYPVMGAEATRLALADAGVGYDMIQQAYAGYVYGDSTCGQRALYQVGMTGIDFAKAAGYPDVFAHGMLVMGYLGQALTDAVSPPQLRAFSTRFVAITQLGARLTCEGHVSEFVDHDGERCAKLALTTKDENGDLKLSGEAVIAL
ncbi:MaoC/PaaZ C-terminal domain-containing protein [Bradyrhizobium sp. LjRoot220]|uniref:hypothetical protein n=1 Tax=Bradyrhizobium sp. LjRoot220 TaxID=3342284 RepID=UPI003ECD3EA9